VLFLVFVGTGRSNNSSEDSGEIISQASSAASYPLADKWRLSHDSWLLRFSLPADRPHLGDDPTLPTCISVQHRDALDDGKVLKKSYSPISHPATVGSFDLLVKSYAPQPGGGVGAGICDLMPGQEIVGKLKAQRLMHGSPVVAKRWDRIGLVAGGTGVAPLVQIIRIVLEDATDTTRIQLLSVNRNEEDILLREELDRLAREHPARFAVRYALTGAAPAGWDGLTGRGSVAMARNALPPPSADGRTTMVFVCGTDGFRDLWAGPGGRDPPKADGSKGAKVQGPLLGILKEAGYDALDVFKY
jgi:cytochrome-b5 reductase